MLWNTGGTRGSPLIVRWAVLFPVRSLGESVVYGPNHILKL
jgi:hypothetical protein